MLFSFSDSQHFSVYFLVRDDFGESPALQFRKWPGLDDADAVADLTLVRLVMHIVFLRALDDFIKLRVGHAGDVFDDEGLVHFIGDDHADTGFAQMDLGVRRLDGCVRRSLAHSNCS